MIGADGLHSSVFRSLAPVGIALAACSSTAPPDAALSAWSLGPPMPRPALDPGVTALGARVVVVGGFTTRPGEGAEISARIDAFDTFAGSWTALPDAPVRWTQPNVAAVNGTLYLAGGFEGGIDGAARTARGEAFALDAGGGWRALSPLPAGEERGAAGVVGAPGRIYLLGGASSSAALASCLTFSVATGMWSALPPLPAPRAHLAAMRRSDGWLIAAGGFAGVDGAEPRGEVWGLPPLGNAWQPLAAMHAPGDAAVRGGCAYGAVLGQLVCAGGRGGDGARDTVESFNPYVDAWTLHEAMPVPRAGTQGAAVGSQLFVPGGAASPALEPTDTLYIYAPLATAPR